MATAPDQIRTLRLVLRRPTAEDAGAILAYASEVDTTRYIGFARHRSHDDALGFVAFSNREWDKGSGPYLILRDGAVIGSTGLHLETPYRATTGYLLARAAWGRGYATEAVAAIVDLSRALGHARLSATVHPDNTPSMRVLDKCGFAREGLMHRHTLLPNLSLTPQDVYLYATVFV